MFYVFFGIGPKHLYVGESESIWNVFFFKDTILFDPVQWGQFSTQSHLFLMHLVHWAPGTSMHSEQYSQHNEIQNNLSTYFCFPNKLASSKVEVSKFTCKIYMSHVKVCLGHFT
jgi:hypothetical protein